MSDNNTMTTEIIGQEFTKDQEFAGAVFYIDGSCRGGNPGFIGWGSHGYLYRDEIAEGEEPHVAEGERCTNVGYIPLNTNRPVRPYVKNVKPLYYMEALGSSNIPESNNVAEMKALYYTVKFVLDQEMKIKVLRLLTDSEQTKRGIMEWCPNWAKRGWVKSDGFEVKNKELWMDIYDVVCRARARGIEVDVGWVKGHADIFGNVRADILAVTGMNHSRDFIFKNDFRVYEEKKFWKNTAERHPYLNFKRLYFNSVAQYARTGVYHFAESPDTDFVIGKAAPDTGYSVVMLNEPDPILETVKQAQFDLSEGINAIISLRMDEIFGKKIYPWLDRYGKFPLVKSHGSLSMGLSDKTVATREENPTGLSLRAIDHFAMLEELLRSFNTLKELKESDWTFNGSAVVQHDITDVFFKMVPTKKGGATRLGLDEKYVVGFTDMSLDIVEERDGVMTELKLPYILGLDCLPRNALKHLEGLGPKMYLITWKESAQVLRHATIIESACGCGIWSNFFADRLFLKALRPRSTT